MNKTQFIEKTENTIKRGSTVLAKCNGKWFNGVIVSMQKFVAVVEIYELPSDVGVDYHNIKPFNEDSMAEIDREKAQEAIDMKNFCIKSVMRLLNGQIDGLSVATDKFNKDFATDPVYAIKWHADAIIQAQYKRVEANRAMAHANRLMQERGVAIEEVILEVVHAMIEEIKEKQLRFDGVRSTSKMEVFAHECEAVARVEMIRDFRFSIGGDLL